MFNVRYVSRFLLETKFLMKLIYVFLASTQHFPQIRTLNKISQGEKRRKKNEKFYLIRLSERIK